MHVYNKAMLKQFLLLLVPRGSRRFCMHDRLYRLYNGLLYHALQLYNPPSDAGCTYSSEAEDSTDIAHAAVVAVLALAALLVPHECERGLLPSIIAVGAVAARGRWGGVKMLNEG